ncbi:YraN family protein [Aneurinibacillus sp. Ricciae_BoGa-3]|uniref:YraN family protein n=1 Tax=Aneurinibacillus sp. Ricciae_BoGa-3 TaxID=3022697 RepID=UPI002341FC1A|nr:YraN family protein [Aneurinibacillus sp. Ricciae_BoGa-3]WCK52918.1 YraN family protein [Aneurinibacillus sp. Ricciae_BoGa-3]
MEDKPGSSKRQLLGRLGEETARKYLEEKGFVFQQANFRTKNGEIDLIMLDGNQLVFIEVKTRKSSLFGHGVEAITPRKQSKIRAVAIEYLQKYKGQAGIRFDVVVLTYTGQQLDILHIPYAF